MSGPLLVPYNDSMRLGQGYNSFLQTPCVHNAVHLGEDQDHDGVVDHVQTTAEGDEEPSLPVYPETSRRDIPQVVSYSSRLVNKMSEVIKSMNISAGNSIKNGGVNVSGNSLDVDELKFSSSDLNIVVSVKVVNQQIELFDRAEFIPPSFSVGSKKFHEIYGDSYIGGFIEGGDLHGIISVKVLDVSKKEQVKAALKSFMNGGSGGNEFTLSKGSGSSSVSSALKQTETTISVNWAGGGQIKPEGEEWSLETLMRAAASFPARVAACPQRTYAILSKYENNLSFRAFGKKHKIELRNYAIAQRYASDLLDTFMDYKSNLARIQHVLSNPTDYKIAPVADPININVQDLLVERKKMKRTMAKIVENIDALSNDPSLARHLEEDAEDRIPAPEVLATRLPVLATQDGSGASSVISMTDLLKGFPIEQPAPTNTDAKVPPATSSVTAEDLRKKVEAQVQQVQEAVKSLPAAPSTAAPANRFMEPPPPVLYDATSGSTLNSHEHSYLDNEANRKAWQKYRFGIARGCFEEDDGGCFNDCTALEATSVPTTWPTRIEIKMVWWRQPNAVVGSFKVIYSNTQLSHGATGLPLVYTLTLDLAEGERVTKIRMSNGPLVWEHYGVSFVELTTNLGTVRSIGRAEGDVIETSVYDGCEGLKGFYGKSGDMVDRMGPIWGKQ